MQDLCNLVGLMMEFRIGEKIRVARAGEGNVDQFDHTTRICVHDDNLISQKHRLVDAVGDQQRG